MRVKAKIFQIIKWEEKEKYFFQTDFGEEKTDMLHLAPIDDDKIRWYDRIKLLFPMMFLSKEKRWKYRNFMFIQDIYNKKGYYKFMGLPLLVPSPTNFKVGDIVEVEYEIREGIYPTKAKERGIRNAQTK